MRYLLLALALLGCAAPASEPPLDPPLNHFTILIGVARLQDHPTLASPPEQARDLHARIGWLQRNSTSLLRLDRALGEALTPAQRAFLLQHLGRPDPLRFFEDLDRSLALLETRTGGPVRAAAEDPPVEPGGDDGLDCVMLAWGWPLLEASPELAPSAEQARTLGPLLARVKVLAWEDEQSMRYLYRRLEPAQRELVRRRARAWSAGRSMRELEEEFETLLQRAREALERRLG